MKSKIFLTSMLVMVVACPALATTDTNGNGTIAYDSTSEPCSGDTLTYNNIENTTGPVYYAPNWVADECTIDLNANGGAHTANSKQTLYTRYDEGAYLDSTRTTYLMGTNANGLGVNGIPDGPTVTTTWNIATNVPINPVTNQAYSLTAISNSTPRKAFAGYWDDPTNPSVQYINSTSPYYIISTAGTDAAKSIAYTSGTTCPSTTWYAKWGCATRTFPADPEITGYHFDGWYTSSTPGTNDSPVNTTCTTSNETLYAKWTPHTGTITYNCGTAPATGITVGGNAPSPDSVGYDDDFELASTANTCALSGGTAGEYSFGGWDCDYNLETGTHNSTPYQVGNAATFTHYQAGASGTFKVPAPNYPTAVSVTCYARWTQNASVNLVWYLNETGTTTFNGTGENPNTCVYGGTMGPLVQPDPRTGYTFNGWTVTTQRQ